MRVTIEPGGGLAGNVSVPGDKSIAHRWLIFAATADGTSYLTGVPRSLDVRSTARVLAGVSPAARGSLEGWLQQGQASIEVHADAADDTGLEVEGDGRGSLVEPHGTLDCGNSGTSMRLLTGVLAATSFRSVLIGDRSLSSRPMERVAIPLRSMGARIQTQDGHAPIAIEGSRLTGITYRTPVPTAQVKSAVLLAGMAADGVTIVEEQAATRDHTERAIAALGGPITVDQESRRVSVGPFQHGGFHGRVPGDPSSAAFVVAAAALTRSEVVVSGVGLNPSRTRFLEVLRRMGVDVDVIVRSEELGEPVGDLIVPAVGTIAATDIPAGELPLLHDEVPALAAMLVHADGPSRFSGAGELRFKESDRLSGLAQGIRDLGGTALVEGDDLLVCGGGLTGGRISSVGDHRIAMAFAVSALAAPGPVEIDEAEAADVSFPGFWTTLRELGASVRMDQVAG